MVDEFKPSSYKQTEFDSSVATLIRIDQLIQTLHKAALGDIFGKNCDMVFLDTLQELYSEVDPKMTKDELKEAEGYQSEISVTQNKFGAHLYMPIIGNNRSENKLYKIGWVELKEISRRFRVFLMRTMDKHNMLMKDSKDAMTRFRTGK